MTASRAEGQGYKMLVRRVGLNRDGHVMNESSVLVRDRTDAVSRILNDQKAFSVSGYDDAKRYYWARPDGQEKYLHQWRIVE